MEAVQTTIPGSSLAPIIAASTSTAASARTSTDAHNLQTGVKDVITLFHAPSNQSSMRVYTMLKQAAATANAHATEDQASDHDKQTRLERTEFDLGKKESYAEFGRLQRRPRLEER